MTCEIFAVRHAPAAIEGTCYGQFDVPVTLPPGEVARQARAGVGSMAFDSIWTSDSPRCLAPARHVAAELGLNCLVTEALREISMGEWEGSRWDDLESEDTVRYRHWMENWESDAPPGGESLVTFEARVRRWHEDLPEGRILLIAHAGVVRALRVLRQGISWSDAMSLPVEHLALTRV